MPGPNSSKLKVLKYFLPYDIYERHLKVASFIHKGATVLDVGGQLGYLSQFCAPAKIVVANLKSSVEKSDILITGDKLPFGDNSFSTVTAIDVLEHIPKNDRLPFIRELSRVARASVILSFPVGTPKHIAYEKQLHLKLTKRGQDVTYLAQHIDLGLPTIAEIAKITKGFKTSLTFSGNLILTGILFKIHLTDPKIFIARILIFWAKLLFNFITNPILYLLLSRRLYSSNVVRAYLVIEKR